MKQQSVTQMQKDVRAILEESVNSSDLEGVSDVGTISLNALIKGVLEKAVTAVANVAPMELFVNPSYQHSRQVPIAAYNKVKVNGTAQTVEIPFIANGHTMAEYSNIDFSSGITSVAYDVLPSAETSSPTKVVVELPANTGASTNNLWILLSWDIEGVGEFSQTITIEQTTAATGNVELSEPVTDACFKFTRYNGSYIFKPNDYLRFLYIQGDSWMRPVTTLTPMSSPFASIARSDVNMSVGNVDKPLVVDSFVGGKGALEIYPSPDETVDFVYVERPEINVAGTSINCDDGIYHAAVLYAAYLVAMIKGYNNAEQYKNAALESITQQQVPTNPTAGAETQK